MAMINKEYKNQGRSSKNQRCFKPGCGKMSTAAVYVYYCTGTKFKS